MITISECIKFFKSALLAAMMFFGLSGNVFSVDCSNPPGGVGLDSAEANLKCAEIDWKNSDAKLNQIYKKLSAKVKDVPDEEDFSKTQLVAAQRAWVAFRDAECELQASLDGGAPRWIIVNQTNCLADFTKERTLVFSKYLNQASGN
jgi:uncharacterized protein YecT (DUF1311 family)